MRKTITALVAVLAIGLTGCTRAQDDTNSKTYPKEAKDNFVSECSKQRGGGPTAKTTCQCIIDRLQASGLPYDTKSPNQNSFKDGDQLLRQGKTLPTFVRDKINQARADCEH